MKITPGSSRYPETLIRKFAIQDDAARKYVPKEDSTLVLNFADHWDKSAERKGSRRFSPFKNSLLEQFKLLSYDLTGAREFINFLYKIFYENRKKETRTFYFSHPSFYKTVEDDESAEGMGDTEVNLDNVAIRYPMERYDVVLMGDIRTVDDTKASKKGLLRREYVVKGISLLNSASHDGETKVNAAIIVRAFNSDYPAFFTTDGSLADGSPRMVYDKSVLTGKLVATLNDLYIVKDPQKVKEYLTQWKDYLTSERQEADDNAVKGFALERPQFYMAYPFPKGTEVKPEHLIVETADTVWSDEITDYVSPRMVVRLVHPINQKLFESDSGYLEGFNKLSALGINVIDPANILAENKASRTLGEIENMHKMSRIGNLRLSSPILEGMPDDEEVRDLKAARDSKIREIRENTSASVQKEVDSLVEEYLQSEEFLSYAEDPVEMSEEALAAEAEKERRNRADEIMEKAYSELRPLKEKLDDAVGSDIDTLEAEEIASIAKEKGLLAEYGSYREGLNACRYSEVLKDIPLEECIGAVKERQAALRKEECIAEYTRKVRSEVTAKYRRQEKQYTDAVYEEYLQALETKKQGQKSRLVVYYEVPLPAGTTVIDEVNRRNKFFGSVTQFKMVCDQVGTQTNINRQMDALESFMNGEVANPYLASYLFPSGNTKFTKTEKIGHLFGNSFNDLQRKAIAEAVSSDGLYLIQGPPGTGKTQVISEITTQEVLKGRKVLISSQNNKAIDNAFERLYKNALIRPVRMMSEGRDSDYDLDCIVSTFYKNIRESLGKKIELLNDPQVRSTLNEDYQTAKRLFEKYSDAKEDAADVLEEIEQNELDISTLQSKIDSEGKRRTARKEKIDSLEKSIAGLGNFELTDYKKDSEPIKDLFRNYMFLVTKAGNRDNESEIEGKLFGRYGSVARMMALSDEDFESQVQLNAEHSEYVALVRNLRRTQDEAAKADLAERISSYVEEHGIDAEEFVLLDIFGSDLPDNLPEIRDRISRIQSRISKKLSRKLEDLLRSEEESESKDETPDRLKKIKWAEEDLEDLWDTKEYKAYVEAEGALSEVVQHLFTNLQITSKFRDMEEAMEILERRIGAHVSLDEEEIEATNAVYRDILDYLETDGVSEIHHDELMKELKNFVNVVGITCTAEGQTRQDLKDEEERVYLDVTTMGIDVVIIDEVSKVPFSELLRPILSGKTVIMVGDHKQLPPIYNVKYDQENETDPMVIEREEGFKRLYTEPLFKTLYEETPDHSRIMLRKQYRMAGQIMGAINRFYGGELEMGCSEEERNHRITIKGTDRNIVEEGRSVLFINCNGTGIRQRGSMSFENAKEAEAVTRMIELLERNCHCNKYGAPVESSRDSDRMSLGVISPYAAQTRLIRNHTDKFYNELRRSGIQSAFRTEGEERFMVKSVDDFQGDERDIVILSLVRTSRSAFISDFRRINVAMSRARRLLVLVGNAESLMNEEIDLGLEEKVPVYREIIEDIKAHGGYLESDDLMEVE